MVWATIVFYSGMWRHPHPHTPAHMWLGMCFEYFEKRGPVLTDGLNYNNSAMLCTRYHA